MIKKFLDQNNPYRFMFPLGWICAFLGSILWIGFAMGLIQYYPSQAHANLMIGGFIFSYALGFLWTAIPRFLEAQPPSQNQINFLFLTSIFLPIFGLLQNQSLFYFILLSLLVNTVYFGIKSFVSRKGNPFPSFIFLIFAITLSIFCLILLILCKYFEINPIIESLARTFFLKGFILFLYLGIGIKLIPVLTGWQPIPVATPIKFKLDVLILLTIPLLVLALAFESLTMPVWAGPTYTIALSLIGFFRMNLGKLPNEKSALAYFVWIAALFITLSPIFLSFFPNLLIHFWHLVFISGFGLMTLFVSLRVTFAHSNNNFLFLEKQKVLYILGLIIILSAITRISAPFIPKALLSHYAYAAATWIVALIIWLYCFIKYTFLSK